MDSGWVNLEDLMHHRGDDFPPRSIVDRFEGVMTRDRVSVPWIGQARLTKSLSARCPDYKRKYAKGNKIRTLGVPNFEDKAGK